MKKLPSNHQNNTLYKNRCAYKEIHKTEPTLFQRKKKCRDRKLKER